MKISKKILYILSVSIFLISGFYLVSFLEENYRANIDDKITNLARLAVVAIKGEDLKNLSVTIEDVKDIKYLELKKKISEFYKLLETEGATGIYTMQLRNGSVFFSVDSWDVNHPLHSESGDLYKLPPKELFSVFEKKNFILAGPYTDEFGYWFSVFIPIIDDATGDVIQVLGLDIDGSYYNSIILNYRIYSYSIFLLISGLILLGFAYEISNRRNTKRFKEAAKLLDDLMDNMPICITGFDSRGKLFFMNKRGKEEHYLSDLSDEEINKKWDLLSSIAEEYRPKIKTGFEAALSGSGSVNIIFKHIPEISSGVWRSGDFLSIKNIDGSIRYVYFMSKDIDAIKMAEADLEVEKNSLEKINRFMIDRELKMVELKNEIKELRVKLDKKN